MVPGKAWLYTSVLLQEKANKKAFDDRKQWGKGWIQPDSAEFQIQIQISSKLLYLIN